MEKYTPAIKSKLGRIVKNTEMIINYSGPSDNLKSEYNSIKDDWNTLKDNLLEKWIDIKFTDNDFEYNGYFNKFSEIGKTNMQKIKGICEDVLAETVVDKKENNFKDDNETDKKPKSNTAHWLAFIGILVAIIIGIASQIQDIKYDQGRQECRDELRDTLNAQQNTIQNLSDSLEKIKLRNAELEKYISLKKTCK